MHRKSGKLTKKEMPKVDVRVYVPSGGEPVAASYDSKFDRDELKREQGRVVKYQKLLDNWVPEDVAEAAKKKVERQMAECKLHIQELKGRIKLRSKKEA